MEPQPGTMPPKAEEAADKEKEEEGPQEGTQEIPPTASARTEEFSQESNQTNMSIVRLVSSIVCLRGL